MRYQILRGGVIEYFIPAIAEGHDWDEMHVQNIDLPEHKENDGLMHVIVVAVPRGRIDEAQRLIEVALAGG